MKMKKKINIRREMKEYKNKENEEGKIAIIKNDIVINKKQENKSIYK